ncbi:MAG: hypothetical protein GY749_13355 [Desulfobacteraceae bacterium]|nr:hypothetical protein [Desulfobacteraceae bacterium]
MIRNVNSIIGLALFGSTECNFQSGVLLKDEHFVIQKQEGDINGDGNIDLTDAIIALKVCSGINNGVQIRADYFTCGGKRFWDGFL